MAIAYDNAQSTSSGANVASLETASWTISGSDRYLIAAVASGSAAPENPTSCKWGGSGGTALSSIGATTTTGGAGYGKVTQYGLIAPSAATQTLYCSWAGNEDETALGGVSYTGVDQTTPTGTQAVYASNAGNMEVTVSSAAGELVVDSLWCLDTGASVGSGQTARIDIDAAGFWSFGMSEEAGAASVVMAWNYSTTQGFAIQGVPLKPAGAAASAPKRALLMGVG